VLRRLGRIARLFLAAALCLGAAQPGPADTAKPPSAPRSDDAGFGRWVIDKWQAEQGLPQNSVEAIIQTRDGYLWAGTQEGLVRFDGVRFTLFDKSNEKAFGSNWVFALNEDRDAALWIATRNGLLRRRNGVFRRFTEQDGLPNRDIAALARDTEGTLWVASTAGVCRFSGERCLPIALEFDFTAERVVAIAARGRGGVWVGTTGNLVLVEGERVTRFTERLRPVRGVSLAMESLFEDASGTLWVGLRNGLLRLTSSGEVRRWAPAEIGGEVVRRIFQNRAGELWLAVDGAGLFRERGGRFESLGSAIPIAHDDRVYSFLEDREGSTWLGTYAAGLWRMREARLGTVGVREGMPAETVWAVQEDASGTMWFGGEGGWLVSRRNGVVTRLGRSQGIPPGDFSAILEGPSGLWIGGYGMGVGLLSRGRTRLYGVKDGLPDDDVAGLALDRNGVLWVGCRSGLARQHGERFETIAGLPPAPRVRGIHVDRDNVVWAGSDRGLVRVESGRVAILTTADGLASDEITSIHEDTAGRLWFATTGGLSWLTEGRFRSVRARDGLFNDNVYAVLEDGSGHLWMSTNKGIFRAERAELERFMRGEADRVTTASFGIADGMLSLEASGGVQSSALRARDGTLWFATTKGAVTVRPDRMQRNPVPPPVAVEELMVDGGAIPLTEDLAVPAGKRRLEFRFTALTFVAPSRVHFKYRLEGFEDDWSEASTVRTAAYTSVPPGRYRFRVLASNEDGVWNEKGADLVVTLEPHFWQTRTFMGMSLLGSAWVVLLGYRFRTARLRSREKELVALVHQRTQSLNEEKERAQEARREAEEHEQEAQRQRSLADQANQAKSAFLANMSHELRTPLNGILGFAQLMDRRSGRDPEDRQHLGTILRSGEHLLGLINEVLSLSKIEAGRVKLSEETFDLDSLLRDLLAMLRVKAEAKGLWLRHEASGAAPTVTGDAVKLRQVLINLLGNAVKFTRSGGVTLRSSWQDGRASFEIEDTGPGIDSAEIDSLFQPFVQTESGRESKEGTGLGLAVSQKISRLMGGEISVNSAPGRGSIFRMDVSLPAASGVAAPVQARDRRRVTGLAPGQERFRVLVVDDVADNRILLGSLLSTVGFELEMASNGEDAIAVWRRFEPHFVWMDKRMAGVDGLEATRRIREEEAARGLPRTKIVALSASALDHERDGILAAGCDDFVPKPFREATVFEKLSLHLGVAYVYEEATSPTAASAVAGSREDVEVQAADLTPDWVRRMQEALRLGDLMKATAIIQELGPTALAQSLQTMVKDYRLEELERILARVDTTHPSPAPSSTEAG
jgi:signal transduction histidine kinase/ligand-binding sensor domain-containing protein/CheY-like chemotaxis protein